MRATDTNGNTTTQNWQVNNGPASGAVPTHDLDGNLLTDGNYTYTWDVRNRMTSVTKGTDTWTFQYDGQNRRISESKNGSLVRQFIWNGTRVMEERIEPQMSGQGQLTHRYWTGGVEMAEVGIDPQANYYLHDHLGSLRVVVGDDGTNQIAAVASYDYSPWGQRSENLTHRTDQYHSPGYTGHWWHVSGLSLAVYRPYDPATGRWPSRDPIGERGGLNLYRYCHNSALNSKDPLGLTSYEVRRLEGNGTRRADDGHFGLLWLWQYELRLSVDVSENSVFAVPRAEVSFLGNETFRSRAVAGAVVSYECDSSGNIKHSYYLRGERHTDGGASASAKVTSNISGRTATVTVETDASVTSGSLPIRIIDTTGNAGFGNDFPEVKFKCICKKLPYLDDFR